MFMEAPETLIYITAGAFFLGWAVGKIGAYFGNRVKARSRDPRDDRIRSLEAELRVSRSDAEKFKTDLEKRDKELAEEKKEVAQREAALDEQIEVIATMRRDLRDSVRKTRELRTELSDRATENVKSEAKLREVETELSVAQASTDLIATGVLDYTMAPDAEEAQETKEKAVKVNR